MIGRVVAWLRRRFGRAAPSLLSPPAPLPFIVLPSLPLLDTPRNRVIVHEAGHALCAWRCTAMAEITVRVALAEGGDVTAPLKGHDVPALLWSKLVVTMGGIAAEALVFKSWSSGPSTNDLVFARGCAEALLTWEFERYLTLADQEDPIAFRSLYRSEPSSAAVSLMNAAYRTARQLVTSPLYLRCVAHLMRHPVAVTSDLEPILGPRLPHQILSSLGKITFL